MCFHFHRDSACWSLASRHVWGASLSGVIFFHFVDSSIGLDSDVFVELKSVCDMECGCRLI